MTTSNSLKQKLIQWAKMNYRYTFQNMHNNKECAIIKICTRFCVLFIFHSHIPVFSGLESVYAMPSPAWLCAANPPFFSTRPIQRRRKQCKYILKTLPDPCYCDVFIYLYKVRFSKDKKCFTLSGIGPSRVQAIRRGQQMI